MIRERLEQEILNNEPLKKYIRRLAKCVGKPYPIVLVDGDVQPYKLGARGFYVRKRNNHAAAWPSPGYGRGYWAHSTRRIEVGSDWLFEELLTRNYKVKHGEEKENRTA